ncbi:glycoside hydrolase family 32 protein [Flavitalea sp.]|nr:glycoside hydrolase family 32 protein [Flavitalea sp.]
MKLKSLYLALIVSMPGLLYSQVAQTVSHDALPDNKPVPKTVLETTRLFRERLLADPFRPGYHFVVPEDVAVPGDPNGAFYHNGRYHLMYLYKREGSGFSWGHISSKDLLHWRHHPDALVPGNGDDGVFSGGAFVDKNGKVTLTYWEFINQSETNKVNFAERKTGISIAQSSDEHYDQWVKSAANPVIRSTDWGITETTDKKGNPVIYGSADPSNIWMKDGKYYMLTGNLLVLNKYGRKPDSKPEMQGDHAYLFESSDLENWTYLHEFYKSDRKWTDKSEDNMCASFMPLPSGADGGKFSGKHLLLFISHNKGCQYYVGSYKNDKFLPDNHGRMTWKDNAYFAPEALIDSNGRQIMWSWVFDDRPDSLKAYYGYTGVYGLPRSLWLGKDGKLRMAPVKELKALRQNQRIRRSIVVKDGSEFSLDGFGNEMLELEITIQPGAANQVGVRIGCSDDGREGTSLYYDAAQKQLVCDATKSSINMGRRDIESAPLEVLKGEQLVLRVFVDKGIVEVFANDKQAIGRSIYPKLGGLGVKLFANGGDARIISVKAWEMMPTNPY